MKSSFLAALAVAVLSAPSFGADPFRLQDVLPGCAGGQCARPASAVQTVHDAGTPFAVGPGTGTPAPVTGGVRVRQVTFVPGQPVRNAGRAVRSLFR